VRYTYVLPDSLAGVARFTERLIANCPVPRATHRVILTRDVGDSRQGASDLFKAVDVCLFQYDGRLDNRYRVYRRLVEVIENGQPDCVIMNDQVEQAALHALKPGLPCVYIVHGDFEFYYKLVRNHYFLVDRYICVSDLIAKKLREIVPQKGPPIEYLPIGTELAPRHVRSRHKGSLTLAVVGTLSNRKGVQLIPTIDSLLVDREIEARWIIVGDGPLRDSLASELPASKRVLYTGSVTDGVGRYYDESDLLIFPSRKEGLPLVVMEAMSHGVVPVASDLEGGVRDVIVEGTGVRVPEGDASAFVNAIERLARDPDELATMRQNARAHIEQHYDVRKCVAEYFATFDEVAGAPISEHRSRETFYCSRLDMPWLPNRFVRTIRRLKHQISRP
jgi:glycosyltransferase involved in cell wall biosynthesis